IQKEAIPRVRGIRSNKQYLNFVHSLDHTWERICRLVNPENLNTQEGYISNTWARQVYAGAWTVWLPQTCQIVSAINFRRRDRFADSCLLVRHAASDSFFATSFP